MNNNPEPCTGQWWQWEDADGGVDNNHIICMAVANERLVMDAEVAEMVHPLDRDNE